MSSERRIYSVSQVNRYAQKLLEDDFILNGIWVSGEISNYRRQQQSGHAYFSLKDENGVIQAAIWDSTIRKLRLSLRDGMQVIVQGKVTIFGKNGKYQIVIDRVEEVGKGELAARLEALKKELQERGMFDPRYKKAIPPYALRIGVVTSETGAVINDIRNVSKRRNPYCRIFLYPSLVQGPGAAENIARGIAFLDQMGLDVIIIGRGGGSMEELWAFNEVAVAEAIFACETPVISAVGHETDFTISDLVADLRAPTPSAAAELAVFDYNRFRQSLSEYEEALSHRMKMKTDLAGMKNRQYRLHLEKLSPENLLREKKQLLKEKAGRIEGRMERLLSGSKERTALFAERLEGRSPLKRLSAGYSFAQDKQGKALTSIRQVEQGDEIRLHVTDGMMKAEVKDITAIKR